MESRSEVLEVYRELARRYEERGEIPMRDRFLILAADAAVEAGQVGEAERLRAELLRVSRHHMLRGYPTFTEARSADDVQTYVRDLRTNYPPAAAARLLASLRGGAAPLGPAAGPATPLHSMEWGNLDDAPGPAPPREVLSSRGVPVRHPDTPPDSSPTTGGPARKTGTPPTEPFLAPSTPADARKPLGQPVPPQTIPVAAPAARPAAREVPATRAVPRPSPRRLPLPTVAQDSPPTTPGAWLGTTLAVLVSLLGVGWLVYTLGRPLWLP